MARRLDDSMVRWLGSEVRRYMAVAMMLAFEEVVVVVVVVVVIVVVTVIGFEQRI